MQHAFPEDELKPLSCLPQTRNPENPADVGLNDVLGNYSLTLIDSLSTLAILASGEEDESGRRPLRDFQDGIQSLVGLYGDGSDDPASGCGTRACAFDLDSKVQVFETNIRGVGGLLSAHLFAVGELPIRNYIHQRGIPWPNGFVYSDQLLRLAHDLATRLLPAFSTPTGIPYPRVNLRTGIPFYLTTEGFCYADGSTGTASSSREITENCAAGAGSLVLEFSTLSRLTGDARFEHVATRAFTAIWNRRSSLDLVGNGIDAETGLWTNPTLSGIGAGIDSFLEYALKSHILLSNLPTNDSSPDNFLHVWHRAHAAVKHHIHRSSTQEKHPFYAQVDTLSGAMRYSWIDNLSAYYPGLLVLAGELDEAIESHLLFSALWTRYAALPERWNTANGYIDPHFRHWAGRPEFVESTFHLYHATKDPWFLRVGEMALKDITRRCWTPCGWADLGNVVTGERRDRMESFFLGETAKYFHLLFHERHPLNNMDGPIVFTTEGHPLVIPRKSGETMKEKKESEKTENEKTEGEKTESVIPQKRGIHHPQKNGITTCPVPHKAMPLIVSNIPSRSDYFHAAALAQLYTIPANPSQTSHQPPGNPVLPGNHTYYPWTLPPSLIPSSGWSSAIVSDIITTLTFPALQDGIGALGALQKVPQGLVVRSLSNMRISLVEEMTEMGEVVLRIQSVGGLMLGREEWVLVTGDAVQNVGGGDDEQFRRVWDGEGVDLWVDISSADSIAEGKEASKDSIPADEEFGKEKVESLMEQLENLVSGILGGEAAGLADEEATQPQARNTHSPQQQQKHQHHQQLPSSNKGSKKGPTSPQRYILPAILPSGPGAAPVPLRLHHESPPSLSLPWSKIFWLDDELCEHLLPAHVVEEYEILVIRRGGCEFSKKIGNIPALTHKSLLELVVVWDGSGAGGLVRPWLGGERQRTPGGLERVREVGMVLVAGGDAGILERVAGTRGGWRGSNGEEWWEERGEGTMKGRMGGRKRVWFESLGVRIGNLGTV